MKKKTIFFGIIGIILLIGLSSLGTAILLSNSYYLQRFPNDPMVKTFQRCGSYVEDGVVIVPDTNCIEKQARFFSCLTYAETAVNVEGVDATLTKEICVEGK